MFRDSTWKGVYRSDSDNLLESFYIPALKESVSYDRAVGFFSASMLSYAAQGVSALVENGGRMRLIFGGEIDAADAQAIVDGYEQRDLADRIGKSILSQIENLADALANQRLIALSWLIANGRLDIKIALKQRGMYHEKIGIFTDSTGDQLVFQGSANETSYALLPDFNFESINVFPGWRSELSNHFQPYIDGFHRLWANQTKNTLVIEFPEAAKEKLVKIASRTSRPPRAEIEVDVWRRLFKQGTNGAHERESPYGPLVPISFKGNPFEIRQHQRDALNQWRSRDFQGILAMATGAGKTVTAIYGLVKLFEKTTRMFLVISVPYQALGDQWIDELSIFRIDAIPCYESAAKWTDRLTHTVSLFEVGALRFAACVVVNRTLESEAFQQSLARIPGDVLAFVGDECHYHGAPSLLSALPTHAKIRLGLSATPKHYFDDKRTLGLIGYYGDVAFEYSLSDALRDHILTPYRYHVHFVDLNDKETEEYLDLSSKISRLAAGAKVEEVEEGGNDQLKVLLFRRARLLGNAENKLVALESLIAKQRPTPFHLFYCGDGDIEGEDEPSRQVDLVSRILYESGWKVSHYTSREAREARRQILDNFRVALIDGLVAIRCLDEGVDIPDCRVAYILASSRNPKQFIQRRGRILRRAPNKEFAEIHDFVVRIAEDREGKDSVCRQLLVNELSRISEFGALAENRSEIYEQLKEVLEQYDLHHYFS